jgi:hypothetical protein
MNLTDEEYDALKVNPLFDVERHRARQKARSSSQGVTIVGILLTLLLGNAWGPFFYFVGLVGTIIAAACLWRD